ncbi:hypothetical protein [Lactonifactor longoviformis]|uniref:hypothetical protein n=1 Tax=Lactonifactor longoviformis TaxID=341220 RepID=UPI001D02DCDC|nr:hypothetical protein [Lactonifactor longoviformis]MCB5711301.1 hypothetical protein [Lactonifactor longoviformis]MCB5715268.1 hypothetical protein [Lactonifactor longoviformis]
MIKKTSNFRKKTPSLFLAVIILLSAVFSSTDNLMAYDESSGYCFQVAENEEGTEADIKGDSTKIYEGVEIIEILDPDGRAMDLDNISYHVTQNDVYLFQIFFRSPAGEQKENISISVNSLLDSDTKTNKADESSDPETNIDNAGTDADPEANANKTDENSASDTKTVGELKAAGKLEQKASTPFLIPMHIEGEDTSQGNYSFSGGDIVNIEEQTFNGLPYKFQQAVILIMEGGDAKTYPINYYDEINGIKYYALSGNDSSPQDFEIAYEVPEGADIFFIFSLNTQSYSVTVNNSKEAEGFQIQYITGIKENLDGTLSAKHNSHIKLVLSYPPGYFTANAPEGKKNVGIEFSDSSVPVAEEEDQTKRTISYEFTYPDKPMTLNVVGDKETTGLMYGIYDATSNLQRTEQGSNWWKATDASGAYTEGQPYYGFGSYSEADTGVLKVRGGTAKNVKIEGKETPVSMATGSFASGQELHFEYAIDRVNQNAKPPYFFWPSPTVSLCYFSNGADYAKDAPITETFPLWSPDWIYDPDAEGAAVISNTYTAAVGAEITITVKKSIYTEVGTSTAGVRLNYPSYQVHVKIENMKNSFYLRTQGAGSVQGPHFFRNLDNISLGLNNNLPDSYFLEDHTDEKGGDTGTVGETSIKSGGMFLDKRAVYNKNITGGGVPWEEEGKPFFKFGITPKWGYTNPRVESYGEASTPIMTNKSIEIEKKELENKNSQTTYPDLTLGKYSWFHTSQDRRDISPFQYVLFMPVESLSTKHDMRAIDVKTEKITGTVTNNADYVNDNAAQNYIVEGDGIFDLLLEDKVVFNPDFKAPEETGRVFAGFTVTITAPDNLLLPADYKLELAKSLDNSVYFKPGDIISISDFFRRDTAVLLKAWNTNHTLTPEEQKRLNLIMYSSRLDAKINLIYEDAASSQGQNISGNVNKYLQDVSKDGIIYSTQRADTKSINVIKGTNIKFNKFAETFVNSFDQYTYYLNEENTTTVDKVTVDHQEIAAVKYDRGLTVSYLDENGTSFAGLSDETVYKTYTGSNKAVIKFPTGAQCPPGKAFDYWTVTELNDTGNWIPKPDITFRESDAPQVYEFASGLNANNKSISLQAVWKDISPDSYISIPKNIRLSESGTNLTPAEEFAGTKATIAYHGVNNSDKDINVDVLKTFDLSLSADNTKKLTVSAYDADGNLLTAAGINESYARIGTFGTGNPSGEIWFNTKSQIGNEVYKGSFHISSDSADVGQGTLFYISAPLSGGAT